MTEFAGPAFQAEAIPALHNIMGDLCPWLADRVVLQSRDLDSGGNTRNADVFGYIKEGTQLPCSSVPGGGLRVLELAPAAAAVAPVAVGAGQRFSPYEPTRMGPHKYFLAEAYSGELDDRRLSKLVQLETLMGFTKQRWEDRTGNAVPDITAIIGVAGLVFSPGMEPRATVLSRACAMVEANARPLTRRLMQAGRYFVMVLDKSQMPNTGFQREMAGAQVQQGQQLAQQGQQLAQQGQQLAQQTQQLAQQGQLLMQLHQQLASIPEEVAERLRGTS